LIKKGRQVKLGYRLAARSFVELLQKVDLEREVLSYGLSA